MKLIIDYIETVDGKRYRTNDEKTNKPVEFYSDGSLVYSNCKINKNDDGTFEILFHDDYFIKYDPSHEKPNRQIVVYPGGIRQIVYKNENKPNHVGPKTIM